MHRKTFLSSALALALTALAGGTALAQESWPSKTIRFVVPYPPGGPTDLMARMLQGELSKRLGVAVVQDQVALAQVEDLLLRGGEARVEGLEGILGGRVHGRSPAIVASRRDR